jgi:hypothetical protein
MAQPYWLGRAFSSRRCRQLTKKSLGTEILIDVGPVDPKTARGDFPIRSLLGTRVKKTHRSRPTLVGRTAAWQRLRPSSASRCGVGISRLPEPEVRVPEVVGHHH